MLREFIIIRLRFSKIRQENAIPVGPHKSCPTTIILDISIQMLSWLNNFTPMSAWPWLLVTERDNDVMVTLMIRIPLMVLQTCEAIEILEIYIHIHLCVSPLWDSNNSVALVAHHHECYWAKVSGARPYFWTISNTISWTVVVARLHSRCWSISLVWWFTLTSRRFNALGTIYLDIRCSRNMSALVPVMNVAVTLHPPCLVW